MNLIQLAAAVLTIGSPGETVLLDFTAPWCGPCRQMDPLVSQLAASGYPVRKINIDNDRALADRYGVQGIPCFVMLVDGKEVDRVVGATDAARLQAMFTRNGAGPLAKQVRGQSPEAAPPAAKAIPFPPADREQTLAAAAPYKLRAAAQNESPHEHLIRASVRLRIEDRKGNSVGSGTIIDARDGEALIITCGHVFREVAEEGKILVDLFGPEAPQGIPATLVSYDIKAEVGIVSIETNYPVAVARLAKPGHKLNKGDRVISIGCDGGAAATAKETQVTSINRYVGSANVQVGFQPVQGRSGGGLFTPEGLVVGVCYAADPEGNEGLFAALPALHEELHRKNLEFIFRGDSREVADRFTPAATVAATVQPPLHSAGRDVASAGRLVPLEPLPPRAIPASATDTTPAADPQRERLSADEYAALEMLQEKARGAEVICIVRPHGNPNAKSEIIVLDQAAAGFLQEVASERQPNSPRRLTSLEIPRAEMGQGAAPEMHGAAANRGPRSAAQQLREAPPWWVDILQE